MARGNMLANFTQYISDGQSCLASAAHTYAGLIRGSHLKEISYQNRISWLTGWRYDGTLLRVQTIILVLQIRRGRSNNSNRQMADIILKDQLLVTVHTGNLLVVWSSHVSIYKSKRWVARFEICSKLMPRKRKHILFKSKPVENFRPLR
jgi:hypothetical protein